MSRENVDQILVFCINCGTPRFRVIRMRHSIYSIKIVKFKRKYFSCSSLHRKHSIRGSSETSPLSLTIRQFIQKVFPISSAFTHKTDRQTHTPPHKLKIFFLGIIYNQKLCFNYIVLVLFGYLYSF